MRIELRPELDRKTMRLRLGVNSRFIQLGLDSESLRTGGAVAAEMTVQLEHYPPWRIAKIRRQHQDYFQKDPVAAVKLAEERRLPS